MFNFATEFMSKKISKKAKEKGADVLLDIIKYVITAVILTTLFSDFVNWAWYWYVVLGSILALLFWIGLSFYKDDSDNNKKKGK